MPTMTSHVLVFCVASSFLATLGLAQSATSEFAAATIRASSQPAQNQSPTVNFYPGRFTATNISIRELIRLAYLETAQDEYRITGGPSWLGSVRFDVNAAAPAPEATEPELRIMLRKLLADRFRLVLHTETRDAPVLALIVGKNGMKARSAVTQAAPASSQIGAGGFGMSPMFQKLTLKDYARWMSGTCATLEFRPVIDKTDLPGEFDLRTETQPALDDGVRRTVVDQLCENVSQLGLELRRETAPTVFYVVDSVERQPTEN